MLTNIKLQVLFCKATQKKFEKKFLGATEWQEMFWGFLFLF